jgi:ribonuclease III
MRHEKIVIDFQKDLGAIFQNRALYNQALVHSSYVNENPTLTPVSNQRLEFIGDAVLGLIIAQKLYEDYTQYNEGQMTQIRAILVGQDNLAQLAGKIKLGDRLILGKGEANSEGRNKPANLASTLEAFIGALYLDRGLDLTKEFVIKLFLTEIENTCSLVEAKDYKSRLQEMIQSKCRQKPNYVLVAEEGPEHNKKFTIEVRNSDVVLGRGIGRSKKLAEMEAAHQALINVSEGQVVI